MGGNSNFARPMLPHFYRMYCILIVFILINFVYIYFYFQWNLVVGKNLNSNNYDFQGFRFPKVHYLEHTPDIY